MNSITPINEEIYLIIDAVDASIYWKDLDGCYLGCNKYMLNMAGVLDRADIIGKKDCELPWHDFAEKLENIDKTVLQTGYFEGEEFPTIVNNTKKILQTKKTRLYDVNKNIIGIVGVSIDITKEKQAETAKFDFINNMEHDLRTPFAGIGGIAEILYSIYSKKHPDLANYFKIMVDSCSQWQEIHNRIFDAIDNEEQQNKIESFYIQDEIKNIKKLMSATASIKKLKLNTKLPALEKTGKITTNRLKVFLILSSLVGNALKFTDNGKITIKLEKEESYFKILIIDTGIGISEEKLDLIFEKFTKLSPSNKYGNNFMGLGLGLYTSNRDAKSINGKINVISALGKGSTFTLTLPITYS